MIMPIIPLYQIILIYLFSALSSYDKEKKKVSFSLFLAVSGIYLFGFVVLYHTANFSYDEAFKVTNFLLFLLGASGLLNMKYQDQEVQIMIPMYQIILILILNAVVAYDKEKHEYNFDILLVFSVFHLGLLFLLYQISIIPSENIANVSIAMLGLLAYVNIFDY